MRWTGRRVHHLAGQHEEGHGQQREAVGAVDQVLRQDLGIEHVQLPHQRDAAQQQREGDRNTDAIAPSRDTRKTVMVMEASLHDLAAATASAWSRSASCC